MKITQLPNYAKRLNKLGSEVAPLAGVSKFHVIMDFVRCYVIYGADEEDYRALELYRKSTSERKKFTTAKKNYIWMYNKHSKTTDKAILDSKCEFNKFYSEFINRKYVSSKENSIEEIISFINSNDEVIAKEDLGVQGIGVFKIKSADKSKIDNLINSIKSGKNNYVIEEVIKQHPDMAYFNDSCVNTCRVETITDREGKSHIINTILITGGKGSSISNTHSGGVMVHIDPESGIVDSKGRNPEGKLFNIHPGTGVPLLGRKIPYWQEVLQLAVRLAEKLPSARYVGWDIAITDKGPQVIEGNLRPGHCTQSCDMVGRWPLIKKYL